MTRLLAPFLAVFALSCGRTEPLRGATGNAGLPATAPELAGENGENGGASGNPSERVIEPLLVDFDLGLLTARTVDGRVAFSQRVTPASRGRQFEHLTSGTGVVARRHPASGNFSQVLGLVRPDGLTAFESDPSKLDVLDGWLAPSGVVGAVVNGGFLVDRGTARAFAFRPVAPLISSGLVATFDDARRLTWVDPKIGAVVRSTPVEATLDVRQPGDALYATTAQTVTESTPQGDTTLPAPFAFPQLVAANRARLVLLTDPNRVRLSVVDFAAATTTEVALVDPALLALGTFVDRALDLDEAGNVYATFLGADALVLLRTADLGAHWVQVGRVPLKARLDVVRATRGANGVLMVGGRARGPSVTEWSFAGWFDLAGEVTELPISGVATLLGDLPVSLSREGSRVAFWSPEPGAARLCVLDTASRVTSVLERRSISLGSGLAVYPALAWLE